MPTLPLPTDGALNLPTDAIPADVIAAYRELQLSSKVAAGASTQLLDAASKRVQDLKEVQATINAAATDMASATQDGQISATIAQALSPAKFLGSVSDGTMNVLKTIGTSFPTLFRGAAVVSTLYTVGKGAVALANDAKPGELREKALEILGNIPGPVGEVAEFLGSSEKVANAADDAVENKEISLSTFADTTAGVLGASGHGILSQSVDIANAGVESTHQFIEAGELRSDIGERGGAAQQSAQGLADNAEREADSLARARDLASLGLPENKAMRDQAQAALEEKYPGIAEQSPPLTEEEINSHRSQLAHAAALSGQLSPDALSAYELADPDSPADEFTGDDFDDPDDSTDSDDSTDQDNLDNSIAAPDASNVPDGSNTSADLSTSDEPDAPSELNNPESLNDPSSQDALAEPSGLTDPNDDDADDPDDINDPDDGALIDPIDPGSSNESANQRDLDDAPDDPDDANSSSALDGSDDPDEFAESSKPGVPDNLSDENGLNDANNLSEPDNANDPDNPDAQNNADIIDDPDATGDLDPLAEPSNSDAPDAPDDPDNSADSDPVDSGNPAASDVSNLPDNPDGRDESDTPNTSSGLNESEQPDAPSEPDSSDDTNDASGGNEPLADDPPTDNASEDDNSSMDEPPIDDTSADNDSSMDDPPMDDSSGEDDD